MGFLGGGMCCQIIIAYWRTFYTIYYYIFLLGHTGWVKLELWHDHMTTRQVGSYINSTCI